MTFYVIDASNSIEGGDPALLLELGDHVLVEYDGSIVANGNFATGLEIDIAAENSTATINGLVFGSSYGIDSTADGARITVNGIVMGGSTGIWSRFGDGVRITVNGLVTGGTTGISVNNGARIQVGQSGEVSGGDAVRLNDNSTLINDGTVAGTGDNAVDLGSGDILNNGLISSYFNAITYGGDWLSFITNTGTIQGNLITDDAAPVGTAQLFVQNSGHWHGSLELSPGADRLTNTGTITGGVQLGDGADRLDSPNGSIFGDILGGTGGDTILTGAEDNTIAGGAGGDTLDGGGGINTLNYGASLAGVKINLSNGTAKYGDAAGDRFSNFQNVTGSLLADALVGDNGDNFFFGLLGADNLTGNSGNDSFLMYGTGTARIDGGDGDDFVQLLSADLATYGSAFTAANRIDGGSGFDTLDLTNTGAVAFGNKTVLNVERIVVQDGSDFGLANLDYGLVTHDATVAAGKVLEVDATPLTGSKKLVFDGSAETDGAFVLDGGAGNDRFTGGAGADTVAGGGGGDLLMGGGGADRFSYGGVTDSNAAKYDTIFDFDAGGTDKFQMDVTVTGIDATQSGSVSAASLVSDLQAVVGGNLDPGHAILVNVTGGTLAGSRFLIVDANGNDGFQAGGDYLIDVTGITGALTIDDFI